MRTVIRSLLAAALAVGLASAALADKRVALIVANGDYKGAPLENPVVDADLVAASLTGIGFTVKVVKNADLPAFDGAVAGFGADAKDADVALFYFAGHGYAVNEGVRPVAVLMATSAKLAAGSERVLWADGVPLDAIVRSAAGQAKATLVFVDAFRSDPRVSLGIDGARGFQRIDAAPGASLFIGLSTRLGAVAGDGEAGKGSPFARAFAAAIQSKGARIDDAFRRMRDAVGAETQGKQLPDIVQDDLPDGAITLVGAQAEPAIAAGAQATPPSAKPPSVDASAQAAAPPSANPAIADAGAQATPPGAKPPSVDAGAQAAPPSANPQIADAGAQPTPPIANPQIADASAQPTPPIANPQITEASAEQTPANADAQIADSSVEPTPPSAKPPIAAASAPPPGAKPDAKLAEAAQIWASLQSSNDSDALALFKEQYAGTFYARMAELRLQKIAPKTPANAVASLEKNPDASDKAAGAPAGDCDRLAASLFDTGRPAGIAGVDPNQIDAVRAIPACRAALAASPNDPRLAFQLARALDKGRGGGVEAFELYRKAAGAGNVVAMVNLGNMLERGRGTPKDLAEASRWYQKAADAGVQPGMFNLGLMYQDGLGVAKDEAEASRWFRKAADAGSTLGMIRLGALYQTGKGVPKDEAEAVGWYRKAADAGSAPGMTNLGFMYRDGLGVTKDEAEAARWYRKAADAGDAKAMSSLGFAYETGLGIVKDEAEALRWYRKAADVGDNYGKAALKRLSLTTAKSP